jgi:hypothetical protein
MQERFKKQMKMNAQQLINVVRSHNPVPVYTKASFICECNVDLIYEVIWIHLLSINILWIYQSERVQEYHNPRPYGLSHYSVNTCA